MSRGRLRPGATRSELTSLFGAEAGDRTEPLGVLWGRREVFQGKGSFQEVR